MTKRVLVTGASGFLGSTVVKQLIEKGFQVVTTDFRGNVDLRGDLSDPSFCSSLPSADFVIHCAAVQYVSENLPFFRRKQYFERNNVLAARNLAARFGQEKGTHVTLVGTSMMYTVDSMRSKPIPSDPLFFGNNGTYSASKVAAWRIFSESDNPVALVVPCIIAGDGRGGLFDSLVKSMARRSLAVIPGSGRSKVHLVHVDDVASLIISIVAFEATGCFNAAGLEPLALKDWAQVIALKLRLKDFVEFDIPFPVIRFFSFVSCYRLLAREQVRMLMAPHVLDIRSSQRIGWQPKWSSKQILEDTVDGWLQRHQSGMYCANQAPDSKPE